MYAMYLPYRTRPFLLLALFHDSSRVGGSRSDMYIQYALPSSHNTAPSRLLVACNCKRMPTTHEQNVYGHGQNKACDYNGGDPQASLRQPSLQQQLGRNLQVAVGDADAACRLQGLLEQREPIV
mmetsp:Transcript_25363/g.57782  ORF Transcript_25363/g.57782 Transcript_25363/m.57782 type:complete len:124 (+) Transcript_25363:48-419(+)